jgi:two-component system, NarL family, response regulator DevR
VIRVLLVEHPPAVRRALRESLRDQPDLRVVGETGSLPRARRLAEQLRPDVVVLDAEMAGLDPRDALRALRARSPTSGCVVITLEPDQLAREREHDGRVDAVCKVDDPAALFAALRRAANRGSRRG